MTVKKKRPAVASAFWHFFRRSRRQLYYYYYYDGERRRNESIENKRISCVQNWLHCLLFLNLNLFGIHHLSSSSSSSRTELSYYIFSFQFSFGPPPGHYQNIERKTREGAVIFRSSTVVHDFLYESRYALAKRRRDFFLVDSTENGKKKKKSVAKCVWHDIIM